MSIDANNMSIKQSGWYVYGERRGDMKNDPKLKNFNVSDVFHYVDLVTEKTDQL